MKHHIISLLIILCFSFKIFGQTDTSFWFSAPDVSSNFWGYDSPIFLRISTTNQASTITISQPANALFNSGTPIIYTIAPNSSHSFDLTSDLSMIEAQPSNTVLNYGLKISATNPVTAYYEVVSEFSSYCEGCNPEIYTLKGKNALGTYFLIPAQTYYNNFQGFYTPEPYASFNIVATENGTNVTINPSFNIVGHQAGLPFNITLNAGQVYAATATSQLAGEHLQGSVVNADKPIAITYSDDLLAGQGGCADLVGDQIVPVSVVGSEYILVKGSMNLERVSIMGTQDNTSIFLNGNTVVTTILNTGETYEFTLTDPVVYINTNAPVYVLHVSGISCELGAALLPPINCTGSSQIGFTRSSTPFYLSLIVRTVSTDYFMLNNNPWITSAMFSMVPGTGGVWSYAHLQFATNAIPVNTGSLLQLTNGDIFHMGMLQGNPTKGCSYGYFSDFNTLNADAGIDDTICNGQSCNINASGTFNYQWSPTTGLSNSNIANPVASPLFTTTYTVTVSNGMNCSETDDIIITVNPNPFVNITASLNPVCAGHSTTLTANGALNFSWSGGLGTANNVTVTPASTTTYTVTGTTNGCTDSKSITVVINPVSTTNNPQTICSGQSYAFNSHIYTLQGTYYDTLTSLAGCDSIVVTQLTVNPAFSANNPQVICSGQSYTFNSHNYSIQGIYHDTLTSLTGCDSIIVTQLTVNQVYSTNNPQTICSGESYTFNSHIYATQGTYHDTLTSLAGCDSIVVTQLTINPVYSTNNPQTICSGQTYFFNSHIYSATGTYYDTLTSISGCDSIIITQLTVNQANSTNNIQTICSGQTYFFNSHNYSTTGIYYDTLTSGIGCDSIIITLLTVSSPSITNNPQTICSGQTYSFNAHIYSVSGTYYDTLTTLGGCDSIIVTQLNVNPVISTSNPQTVCSGQTYSFNSHIYSTTGIYNDTLTATTGCDSIIITLLTVIPPIITNNPQTLCSGHTYSFNAHIYFTTGIYYDTLTTLTGCDSIIVTLLTVNPASIINNPQTICNGQSYSVNGNIYIIGGTYYDTLTTVLGCDSVVITQLTVMPVPVISILSVNDTICSGDNITLTASGGTTYTWINGLGNINPITATPNSTTTYTVTGTASGCTSTASVVITVIQSPIAAFSVDPLFSYIETNLVFFNLSSNATTYFWNFNDGNTSNEFNPVHCYQMPGSYLIWLYAQNSFDCIDSTSQEIEVITEETFYMPTAFTPNGNGINDLFGPQGVGIDNYLFEVYIFDRWGKLIFKTFDYNEQWNGKYLNTGKLCPQDVYTWVVFLKNKNSTTYKSRFLGTVTLL